MYVIFIFVRVDRIKYMKHECDGQILYKILIGNLKGRNCLADICIIISEATLFCAIAFRGRFLKT
jgi:hypothetical protein